ncbi:sulfatase-like hydrolase/transferase, partial [bacterium]|nr:sulfatase-like hydrolase/transferase [bacterium]
TGVLFTNAHCPAPACNPSRTAIMTGIPPYRSGLYDNRQKMRTVLPDAELLPKYLSRHGYWSAGSGKLLHYFIDAKSWDEYFPNKETENPFPRTLMPEQRPVNLPLGGNWQYRETDWAPLDATNEEYGGDWLVSDWIGKQLKKKHDRPFFLACGIYRPHEPWFVPQKYFDQFPIETIQLPPGYRVDDLDDLPAEGKRRGPNRYFEHIRKHDQWKQGVQGYLASIVFADEMVGRVLDALQAGPNHDNTIVMLWSDHGWHLGEKQHWQKYTAWRACTRVPLIIRVPAQTPGLEEGTQAGGVCDQPVNLSSLFSTVTELVGHARELNPEVPSLVPLLRNPSSEWDHVAVTCLSEPGSYGLSTSDWRYIRYAKGGEELYRTSADPYEWNNLASIPEYQNVIKNLSGKAPIRFAPKKEFQGVFFSKVILPMRYSSPPPASSPVGRRFQVEFDNQTEAPVFLYWRDQKNSVKLYGKIEAGTQQRQFTRKGAVWMITKTEVSPSDVQWSELGYFVIGKGSSRAVIKKNK